MIAASNSCFNLIYLLKRLQGFEGQTQCRVISQDSTQRNATSQLETLRIRLAFSGSALGFKAFWKETFFFWFCESTFLFNGRHLVGHMKDTSSAKHPFPSMDRLKGILSISLLLLSTGEWQRSMFMCLSPFQSLPWTGSTRTLRETWDCWNNKNQKENSAEVEPWRRRQVCTWFSAGLWTVFKTSA